MKTMNLKEEIIEFIKLLKTTDEQYHELDDDTKPLFDESTNKFTNVGLFINALANLEKESMSEYYKKLVKLNQEGFDTDNDDLAKPFIDKLEYVEKLIYYAKVFSDNPENSELTFKQCAEILEKLLDTYPIFYDVFILDYDTPPCYNANFTYKKFNRFVKSIEYLNGLVPIVKEFNYNNFFYSQVINENSDKLNIEKIEVLETVKNEEGTHTSFYTEKCWRYKTLNYYLDNYLN